MPIIVILLIAALVATFGFWGALKGILGAIGVIVLLCLLAVLTVSFLAAWLLKRSPERDPSAFVLGSADGEVGLLKLVFLDHARRVGKGAHASLVCFGPFIVGKRFARHSPLGRDQADIGVLGGSRRGKTRQAQAEHGSQGQLWGKHAGNPRVSMSSLSSVTQDRGDCAGMLPRASRANPSLTTMCGARSRPA